MDGWLVFARLKDWQSQSLGDLHLKFVKNGGQEGAYLMMFKVPSQFWNM